MTSKQSPMAGEPAKAFDGPFDGALVLEIEPGRGIEDACHQAQRLADVTDITVKFDFNGVQCRAVPGGSAERLRLNQMAEQARKPRAYSDR